jgi:arsenate reductase-like glutaredoxin family protein
MTLSKEAQLKQSKENLRKIFAENPALKQAFKETIDELSKPEHIDKMANDIHNAIKRFVTIKNPIKD